MVAHEERFAAVVFDFDGVLVESEHLWEENWTRHAADYGYAWQPSDTAVVQGMSVPEWSGYLADRIGSARPTEVAESVIAGMIGALHSGRAELLPGAREMVIAAADRVPVAVASSAALRMIEAVLQTTGLRERFAAYVSSEEVPRGKPSPDVYLEAARRIGIAPEQCAAIEDSSNGLRAAAAAGMTVIAIPNPAYPPQPDALALCAKIATSPDDVRHYLIERLPVPAIPHEKLEVTLSVESAENCGRASNEAIAQ